MRVAPYNPDHLPQLTALVNTHLGAAVPGWAVPEATLARQLARDDCQYVTDPWVAERATVCALEGHRVLAAAHLLRYRADGEVGPDYGDVGEIGWFLCRPGRDDAAAAVLVAARERLAAWRVGRERGWGLGLPVPTLWGVPDAWPHVAAALASAGYRPDPSVHRGAVYAGRLDGLPPPGDPPLPGLRAARTAGDEGTRFSVLREDQEIGACEVVPDLTCAGALPAQRGWADLWGLRVDEPWRRRGVGAWLTAQAAAWLRLAGRDRIVVATTDAEEAAGSGRFYERLGLRVLARETNGWVRP